jgi:hypothetical protein
MIFRFTACAVMAVLSLQVPSAIAQDDQDRAALAKDNERRGVGEKRRFRIDLLRDGYEVTTHMPGMPYFLRKGSSTFECGADAAISCRPLQNPK